jgi:MFS family permease
MQPLLELRNYRIHLLEGMLYIASGSLLSGATVIPAIVISLGGTPAVVGALPVIVYVTFQVPQLFSALHARTLHHRKPWVIKGGLAQRLHILALGCVLAAAAGGHRPWHLVAFLAILALNQVWAGVVSPVWIDFLARTTATTDRSRLLGWRSAGGAFLSFVNSFVLTALLTWLGFSWGVAAAFGLAFALQLSSVLVQRGIVEAPEESESRSRDPHGLPDIVRIVRTDVRMRRFLLSWGFITAASTAGTFFIPSAIDRFHIDPATIGVYTMVLVAAQVFGGATLGWISERYGPRGPLMVSALSMAVALIIATVADRPATMAFAFLALGIPLGAEMMARYNFAIEAAPLDERPLYIGIMNAWLAPWQALSILAGFAIATWGYQNVFLAAVSCSCVGLALLRSVRFQHPG